MPSAPPADGIAVAAAQPHEIDAVRSLFRDYADWLQADICLQGFERELAELPGAYAPPRGRLLLARDAARLVGVVALRPLPDGAACEMKRLYVRPEARGRGIGRRLVVALLAAAREAGYRRMTLETLERMGEARQLYARLGFAVPSASRRPSDHPIALEIAL